MHRSRILFTTVMTLALAACGGGGSVPGPGLPVAPGPTGAPAGGGTSAPAPGGPGSTPPAGATPPGGMTPPANVTPPPGTMTPPPPVGTLAGPTAPPDAAGHTNAIPPLPAAGTCRTGQIYSIYVDTPTGDTEAFTVFEPATFCGGKTYPLVLQGAGYSGSRQTSLSFTNQVTGVASPGNIGQLVAANYAVISLDERGFGEDGGTARVMDPNFEGLMDLSVMDWAQAKLPWLAYGPTNDGADPHEPIFGSIGGSYGGMYQYMLLNIDKRHRLRAIAPQISPNDLNYALFPNGVVKSDWDLDLFVLGQSGGSGISYAHEDPFLANSVTSGITTNTESPAVHDFFGYHSASYFCNGASVGSDGDAGSTPLFAPAQMPPKVHALFLQGMRDTLFTFNDVYNNYSCFKRGGGDVRLLTYQYGHNALQVVPDPYVTLFYPPTEFLDQRCGSLDYNTATLAWFDQYLKGIAGAAAGIPTEPCLSIQAGDAVLVPSVTTGHAGTAFPVPPTAVIAGGAPDVPTAVALGPAFTAPGVVAGLPRLEVDVRPVAAALGEPFLFVGIGQMHANRPGLYDLLDNQVAPLRGAGEHDVDLTGIAARVAPGDKLFLLIYGAQSQYVVDGSTNLAKPAIVPVTVTGNAWLPLVNAQTAP